MSTESAVAISLTPDQALVLFEWLAREDGKDALPTEHPAELQVLWDLEAQLERVLVEPFRPDYAELLAAARERLTRAQ